MPRIDCHFCHFNLLIRKYNGRKLKTLAYYWTDYICTLRERKQKITQVSDHHNALKTHLHRNELQQAKGKCD